jgi:hypothetical protein
MCTCEGERGGEVRVVKLSAMLTSMLSDCGGDTSPLSHWRLLLRPVTAGFQLAHQLCPWSG